MNKILLRSSVAYKYSDTSCLDVENSLTFWNNLEFRDCIESELEVLYEGNIQAITETRNNVTKIHYFISHNNFLGSFTFNGIHEVCHIGFCQI